MIDDRDDKPDPHGDEALLKEIRENYSYATAAWREIREESMIDRRYIAGDPWDPADRKAREESGRPCINHDELGQYVNQAVNNLRQNKRGIKVAPIGGGANEKTAELRQDIIRTIEYRSNAQFAYVTAFQAALEGGYGFFRISRKYKSDRSFAQEIVIKNIANSDSVLYDPDCKEADWSDARYCFILDPIPRQDFKARYPDARLTDFTSEERERLKDWVQDKQVLLAEYWRVEIERKTIFQIDGGEVLDDVPPGAAVARKRTVERKNVVQYVTNGAEILERNPQLGTEIPILIVTGKEMYLDDGGNSKRKLMSLVRLARDPQMSLAYLNSQEMEEAGLSPKTPYVGYKGQFESDAEAWKTANKVPHAYLQADPVVEAAGGNILPLPRREQFTPNFGAYELAKDSCRRAIQAAMGTSPLPTAAQRINEKSGVALERIQQAQAIGSFHFIDNFDRALTRAGRIVDSWIPPVYGHAGEISIYRPDETSATVRLSDQGEDVRADIGEHDITVSAGPSYQSQRDEQKEFLDTLIASLGKLPVAPPQAAQLLSMAIRLKNLGPKGDEMADIVSPRDKDGEIPPQAQQAIQQAQQQLESLNAYAQQLEVKVQELQREREGKVVENEYRLQIERLKIEADIARAEISTKAQALEERVKFVEDLWAQLQQHVSEAEARAAEAAAPPEPTAEPAAPEPQPTTA